MSNKKNRKVDPNLKARFKEIARTIIAEDRAARKFGVSQNTIGKITSSLTNAYLMGQNGEKFGDMTSSKDFVDWVSIPLRARNTLEWMSFGLRQNYWERDIPVSQIERLSNDKKSRWKICGSISGRTVSNGAVTPLIRLNLIEQLPNHDTIYRLTELGQKTCVEYWRRVDAGDPNIPLSSLR